MEPTYVTGKPKLWLRLEGLVLIIATVIIIAGVVTMNLGGASH
jgi:hypothetical protein